ncbi:Far-red impaired response 1-like [Thalictrum thalictroides]|uniref:Far-red impaired response 1-like n=1 Tax=Thalictrum thalictroides TaxID=46969 RepID=A0A7J6UW89_THATH|nr:Far-red impaired response 1-like [Thalictrum thalictroides]
MKRKTSKKGDDGEVRWVMFTCARSGKSKSSLRNAFKVLPINKTNCNAKLDVVLYSEGRWRVTLVHNDHNHDLSPEKSRYYKNNRVITPFVKKRLKMNDRVGIRPNKSYNSIVVESGGHENVSFLQKDCYNILTK